MATPQPSPRDPAIEAGAFWFRFRREILALVVFLLVAALGWGAYRLYSDRRDASAAVLLAGAKSPHDYQDLIAQYGQTPAAASAYLFLAEAQRKEGKLVESNATLQAFIDRSPDHELVPTAKMAIAANLEATGKVDEALALYKQIAAKYPKSFAAPLALMSQLPLLKAKNQTEEARRQCETVLSQYGDSYWASEAMRELRSLKPAPAPQSVSMPAVPPGIARPPEAAPIAPPQLTVMPKPK
jgi:predicted negative regulator of RcsB-dependent stress response